MRRNIIVAIMALALVVAGGVGGYGLCAYQLSRGQATAVQKMERENQALQRKVDAQATALEKAKGDVRVVYKTITKEVKVHEKSIPDTTCFGPSDVRLLNRAARGKENADVPKEPPGPHAGRTSDAGERIAQRGPAHDGRVGAAVSGVPRQ